MKWETVDGLQIPPARPLSSPPGTGDREESPPSGDRGQRGVPRGASGMSTGHPGASSEAVRRRLAWKKMTQRRLRLVPTVHRITGLWERPTLTARFPVSFSAGTSSRTRFGPKLRPKNRDLCKSQSVCLLAASLTPASLLNAATEYSPGTRTDPLLSYPPSRPYDAIVVSLGPRPT